MELKGMFLLLLTACGPDAFFSIGPFVPDEAGDAAGDASEAAVDAATGKDAQDAAQDSNVDAACMQPGGSACDAVMEAYCARLAACCNGGCGYPWTEGGQACRTHFAAQTEDCSSATFTSKLVCYADTAACTNAIPAATCNVIMSANPRSVCDPFWMLFK